MKMSLIIFMPSVEDEGIEKTFLLSRTICELNSITFI